MVITVSVLALLGLAFLLPNYVAVRYAVLGGAPGAVVARGNAAADHTFMKVNSVAAATGTTATSGGGAATAPAPEAAPAARRSRKWTQHAYFWKALSPLVLAATVILSLGQDPVIALTLVGLALLNLIYGCLGWDGYDPARN